VARNPYAEAGVDVAAGDRLVDRLRQKLDANGLDLLGSLGGFAAAIELPSGLGKTVLVTSTDGVGTKTEIARQLRRFDTIGQDLVAMCADDMVCHGARPAYFLDYVAVGSLAKVPVGDIVSGIADALPTGCSLIGGETAEHPGVMADDAFDLAGFCIGFVDRAALIDGSAAREGDAVIGLRSSGLHANGYSLVRSTIAKHKLALDISFRDLVSKYLDKSSAKRAEPGQTLGQVLLEPTFVYSDVVLALRDVLEDGGFAIKGVAHITGGGLPGNLPRAVGADLGVAVTPQTWPVPLSIQLIANLAGLSAPEMRATFNGGIGMAIVLDPAAASVATGYLENHLLGGWQIGRVVRAEQTGSTRYVEA
jgi:phosphoribosylformylglycinamidine cyclo-ligase